VTVVGGEKKFEKHCVRATKLFHCSVQDVCRQTNKDDVRHVAVHADFKLGYGQDPGPAQ